MIFDGAEEQLIELQMEGGLIRDEIEITENNSTTFPGSGLPDYGDKYDGVKTIKVNVHVPIYHFGSISISENTTIKASEKGLDGFDEVTVNVPTGGTIKPLTVKRNGTYIAADYKCDGFDPVNVNNPYELLWKVENDEADDIPTDGKDPEGDTIVIDGFEITDPAKDIDDIIKATSPKHVTSYDVTIPTDDGETTYVVKVSVQWDTFTQNGRDYFFPRVSFTNLNTGDSVTYVKKNAYADFEVRKGFRLDESHLDFTSSMGKCSYSFNYYDRHYDVSCDFSRIGIDYNDIRNRRDKLKYYLTD